MRVCWSVKGGVGTTIVSAVVALHRAAINDARLVDLAGDLPATLGVPEPGHEGFGEWLANDAPLETIDHLAIHINEHLDLVPRGDLHFDVHALRRLAQFASNTSAMTCEIVVDAGTNDDALDVLLPHATTSWLVLRPCYLALRRAVNVRHQVDGIVLINEPGRALSSRDVAAVLTAPIIAEIDLDPRLSRVVDAGLLASRMPSSMTPLQRAA